MKKTTSLILFCVALSLAPYLRAASEADLGEGLVYVRLTEAATEPEAIKDALARHSEVVIDVRSLSRVAPALPTVLRTALASSRAVGSVHLILINATTSPAVISAVSEPALAGVLTLGPKSASVEPDIAVNTTDEKDRQAHEAIAKGTAPDTLINENREKRRFDEARLVQNHVNGITDTDESVADPADATDPNRADESSAKTVDKKAEVIPVVDLVLSRAVQLHRAMRALRQP